jgi:DNA-binding MarR family transcriptional regulator
VLGKGGPEPEGPAQAETCDSRHSDACLRLMRLLPRITRGIRRFQGQAAPPCSVPLSPRHVAVLELLRDGPLTVGTLAGRLELTLSTVSGVLADLDRAGFITREADAGDRRRTVVQIAPGKTVQIRDWLDGAADPLARVFRRLEPAERDAFLKAMDMLEEELRAEDSTS